MPAMLHQICALRMTGGTDCSVVKCRKQAVFCIVMASDVIGTLACDKMVEVQCQCIFPDTHLHQTRAQTNK